MCYSVCVRAVRGSLLPVAMPSTRDDLSVDCTLHGGESLTLHGAVQAVVRTKSTV